MRVLGYCTRCRKPKPVRASRLGPGVPVGLCSACEEREERPTDLVMFVPAADVESPVPAFSALVGRSGLPRRVAWEPSARGPVTNQADYESMLSRAAERLLRHPGGPRTIGVAGLVPVGVFDARRGRIVRIDDRATLDRWLGREPER